MRLKLLSIPVLLFTCMASQGQTVIFPNIPEGLYKFSKSYFRSDPIGAQFSTFLKHLLNDPAIHNKFSQPKTDTSLYSFFGTYTGYNPFFFTPKRVEILLEEKQVKYSDTTKPDTIFMYQLLAYANDDAAGESDIKKEFEKINRQNNKKFENSNYGEIKDGEIVKTAMYNYFVPFHALAPLSLIRGKLPEQHEWVLNITLRFKMDANEVVLATPFYGP